MNPRALAELEAVGEPSYPDSPERDLWVAVIALAVRDAECKSVYLREPARAWLLDSPEFLAVCALAGVEPAWARDLARARLGVG